MPTYTFRCPVCGLTTDVIASIRDYSRPDWRKPRCHEQDMERFFTAPDPIRALDCFVSDAIYAGLVTLDGVDVSTREKHRAYMKERGLTTMDDFKETWVRDAQARAEIREGIDPRRRDDVHEAIERIKAR